MIKELGNYRNIEGDYQLRNHVVCETLPASSNECFRA